MKKICILMLLFFTIVIGNVVVANSKQSLITPTNRAIVVMKKNHTFKIIMQANRTTGYDWYLTNYNRKMINPIKRSYTIPNNKLMGAPGLETWYFSLDGKAFLVPQKYTIVFTSMRPWELSSQTKQRYVIVTSDT